MKKLSISKITEKENNSLEILKKHYGVKTASGATRIAIVNLATAIKSIEERKNKLTKKLKP